jgi:hypothetical protein
MAAMAVRIMAAEIINQTRSGVGDGAGGGGGGVDDLFLVVFLSAFGAVDFRAGDEVGGAGVAFVGIILWNESGTWIVLVIVLAALIFRRFNFSKVAAHLGSE